MDLFGKATIQPIWFYSGKICGYATWILFALSVSGVSLLRGELFSVPSIVPYVLFSSGVVVATASIGNLGRSTTLGLPARETQLRTNGLYRFSRNPIYVGFHLMTHASIFLHAHVLVVLLGVFSFVTYHAIIVGEERFLRLRFGESYIGYAKRVRRYL